MLLLLIVPSLTSRYCWSTATTISGEVPQVTCGLMEAASILTTLSNSSVGQNEPLRLTFEIVNGSGDPPDLAPLNRDFHIAHRSNNEKFK